jgi:hypothetical protein
MKQSKRCIATRSGAWLVSLALCMSAGLAHAAPVGAITHLSGPLLDKKADGSVKVLAVQSTVEQGDTLVTQKDTYAQIKFTDDSLITLRPDSQFKIDSFSFEPEKKENDSALFSLIKGGLREVTGLLGKRSKERFGLHTPTATIGIRGTIFVAEYLPSGEENEIDNVPSPEGSSGGNGPALTGSGGIPPPLSTGRAPGLYVQVLDGMIHVSNNGGTQNFAAGQFGYTASFRTPPIILPNNPGIKFSPPPSFSSSIPGQGSNGATGKNGTVDCEVR